MNSVILLFADKKVKDKRYFTVFSVDLVFKEELNLLLEISDF